MNQSTLRQLGYEFFAYKVRENGRPQFIDLRYKGRIVGTFRDVNGAFVCSESEHTPHLYTNQLKGVRLDKSHDVFHFVAKQVAGHTSHQEECGDCGCADEEECVTTDECIDVQSVLEDVDEVHTALTDLAVRTERIADVLDCVDWEQANWNAERSRMINALESTSHTLWVVGRNIQSLEGERGEELRDTMGQAKQLLKDCLHLLTGKDEYA